MSSGGHGSAEGTSPEAVRSPEGRSPEAVRSPEGRSPEAVRSPAGRGGPPASGRRSWRATLFALHRDIGFLCLGLTVVYAISGIAVNHRRDWDYNRSEAVESVVIGPPAALLTELSEARRAALALAPHSLTPEEEPALRAAIGQAVGRTTPPRNGFWRGPDRLSLFFAEGDADAVDYVLSSGTVTHTARRDRALLRDLNFLHLNESAVWTFFADGYAALLFFLAVSGVVMARGRHGLRGRGGVLAAVGIALPVGAVVLLRYI